MFVLGSVLFISPECEQKINIVTRYVTERKSQMSFGELRHHCNCNCNYKLTNLSNERTQEIAFFWLLRAVSLLRDLPLFSYC